MNPNQAIRLLSVEEWPPRTEHWPPRDKNTCRPGMHLVGRIERTFTLPRGKGSHHEGEFYPAMWIRRWPDGALVTFHGYHTAALQDLPAMEPAPGLLFAGLFRGRKDSGFEDFKFIVAPWDDPPAQPARAGANGTQQTQQTHQTRQVRQADGQPTEASSAHAPEGGTSGGGCPTLGFQPAGRARRARDDRAGACLRAGTAAWQEQFREQLGLARVAGDISGTPSLQQIQALIARTVRLATVVRPEVHAHAQRP